MAVCKTVKVKPWGKDQGDFVEINAEDFDASKHELADGELLPEPVAEPEAAEAPEAAPTEKPAAKPRVKRRRRVK